MKESTALRAFAWGVLVSGLVGSGAFYLVRGRAMPPPMDELSAPGYLRARGTQQRLMLGPMGGVLTEWNDMLQEPGVQAALIAGVSVLVSWALFRIAAGLDGQRD